MLSQSRAFAYASKEQQYHVVPLRIHWVGLKWGWGRRASRAVYGIGAGVVHGWCRGAWDFGVSISDVVYYLDGGVVGIYKG